MLLPEDSGRKVPDPSTAPASDAQDPRFASGIPTGTLLDPETFVRLSGLVRRRQEGTAPQITVPLARPQAGMAAGAQFAPAGRGAGEEMNALLALQRLGSNSRLLEAEQLLHALERQPRVAADTPPPGSAPLLPKGIMIRRREKRSALPLVVLEEESAGEEERPPRARLVRLLVTGMLFAVICWVLAYYLIGFVRNSVLPDLLDTWSPGSSNAPREKAGGASPPPSRPAPQVREDISPPSEPAP